jgi:ankyrin repeat protein
MYGWDGMTPLHQVFGMGSRAREIFDLLLDKGAELSSKDEDGRTPLFFAVPSDSVYFTQRLVEIEKGTAVGAVDNDGDTPLHIATGNRTDARSAIISLLLNHRADLEAKEIHGRTSLPRYVTMREFS